MTLQLQNLAHEELGFGISSKGTDKIPTTETGGLLCCLDLTNLDHPMLGSSNKQHSPSEGDPRKPRLLLSTTSASSAIVEEPAEEDSTETPNVDSIALEVGQRHNRVMHNHGRGTAEGPLKSSIN
ncbi:hypothetical protein HD806DRAFT_511618 [Xylariaceae sp. AK1471]|nr:hypothetical protein HD806DRAFT_511618 [Xylariaceae sp. AK1471]